MSNLFEELKRRNVFRVGSAYLVVGWIVLQVIDVVQPALGLPEWIATFVIYLLLAGLPVTLILTWIFEITPQGIMRDEDAKAVAARPTGVGRKLDFVIIGLLVVALSYFVWEKYYGTDQNQTATNDGSIAVLPFADLSPLGDQEYFADGISEEILNVLAKVPDLRVAARTSSFQFKQQNLDIPLIAKRLNVANVLEGSVRKAGTRVRITAQLIDAETGFHLWSDTYDREMQDILVLQDEIAAAIVGELKQLLSADWDMVMPVRAALADSAAYDEYLLGKHLIRQRNVEPITQAVEHFRRASEIDPDFAPAWASLATGYLLLSDSQIAYGSIPAAAALEQAREANDRALALDPELSDAHAVQGLMALMKFDIVGIEAPLKRAIELNPGDMQARHWLALAYGLLDRLEDSLVQREEIIRRDPLFPVGVSEFANALILRGRYEEARVQLERLKVLNSRFYARHMANLAVEEGRYADAMLILRPHQLDSGTNSIKIGFAVNLLAVGLAADAAVILGPNDPQYLTYLGQTGEAIAAINAMPESNSALRSADSASLLSILGEHQVAVDMYDSRVWNFISEENWRYLPIGNLTLYAFALKQTGATEKARKWLEIAEERIENRLAAGDKSIHLNLNALEYWLVREQPDRALPYLQRALSQLIYLDGLQAHSLFGPLVSGPEFEKTISAERNHRRIEREKFLAIACAETDEDLWHPLPESCAAISD